MQEITRRTFLSVATLVSLGLSACGGSSDAAGTDPSAGPEPTTLSVFAAASLTESLQAAGERYAQQATDVALRYDFDSSGTLKTQIEQGAEADVFISAGQRQMNQLDAEATSGNDEGLDLVDHATRFDILENKVTLCVPEGNPKGIQGFDDLAGRLRAAASSGAGDVLLAMGNSDVPVGQYTQKILAFYGLDEEALAKAGLITYGTNVKEVTTQVGEAAVDCGVIYATDAHSAGLAVVDEAIEDMCGRVVYPAAALKASRHPDATKAYLDFLKGPEASACFKAVGFTPLASA